MEAIEKFATGSSSVEDFARHVRIKSLLANQLGESIRAIQRLWVQRSESIDAPNSISDFDWIQSIERLTDAIEAMFLHGLRAKLSLSRMLAPAAKFSSIASPSVSTSNASFELIGRRLPDFWPVLLILSHNQVSEELKTLCNVRTDIGRCRAWIRLALNESLLPSYFETLINDTSLLHGFYRPYAFLRDKQQTARLCHLLTRILDCIFNLPLNEPSLNCWSATALRLIGIDVPDRSIDPTSSNQDHKNKKESKYEEKEDDEQPDHLKPVMPAIDALQMLSSSPAKSEPLSVPKISRFFSSSRHKEAHVSMVQSLADEIQQASTPKLPVLVQKRPGERDATETVPKTTRPISSGLKKTASGNSLQSRLDGWSSSPNEIRTDEESDITTALTLSNALDNSTSQISIKGRAQIDMSSSNNQKIPTQRPHYRTAILADEETSYNSLLNSYSKGAVLSTTPDLHDIYFRDIRLKSTSENDQSSLKPTEMATATSGVKKSCTYTLLFVI